MTHPLKTMTKADLLNGQPDPLPVTAGDVRAARAGHAKTLIVLDDDPTGTQSIANLPVLTRWTTADLTWALEGGAPAVYVMTNSRSLDPDTAAQRNREVATSALAAAAEVGMHIDFVSRSDSTLRGHYPLEPDVLTEEMSRAGITVDGVIIVPAFADAGRITVDSIHYAGSEQSGFTPAGQTEFAKDATFGYAASNLTEWVAEKTQGRYPAQSVATITLATLRSGPQAVAAVLQGFSGAAPVVVDIVEESDLRVLALGIGLAESAGKRFIHRVGPPFVRALVGQDIVEPLTGSDVDAIRHGGKAERAPYGLIVVGSHVSMTTRQLDALRARRQLVEIEIDVAKALSPQADAHLDDVVARALTGLRDGNVIIRTSRVLVTGDDGASSLDIARRVSDAVVHTVQEILAATPPRFVVAKGGITSSDVASRGLSITRAICRGPMLPGIVSLWEPTQGPAEGIPYIVFAGNVGDEDSLADVVDKLSAVTVTTHHPQHMEEHMTDPTMAVLGLGAMGLPMATRLAERFTVRGFDPNPERGKLGEQAGLTAASSARAAADGVDAVLLAVRNRAQLEAALYGANGVCAVLRKGALIILTSTVGIDAVREVAAELAEHGLHLVDAPISGGPLRAGSGDLLITVGATDEAYQEAEPMLSHLSSTLKRMGDKPGDGQAMKTVNQLLCGVHIAAAAEALALAKALGLDPELALEALNAGAAASFMLADRGPRILQAYDEGGAEVRSRVDIFTKDMGIVARAAQGVGLSTPVASAAEQLFLTGQAHGLAAADDSSVITVIAPKE